MHDTGVDAERLRRQPRGRHDRLHRGETRQSNQRIGLAPHGLAVEVARRPESVPMMTRQPASTSWRVARGATRICNWIWLK